MAGRLASQPMNLARTTALNGLAVIVRLASGLVLNKALAVYVGPAGFGLVGQFQSFVAMVAGLAGGALSNGVTKLTSQHGAAPERQLLVWRTALSVGMAGTALSALLLLVFARPLAGWLLGNTAYSSVMGWLAATLVLVMLNALVLAVLAGTKQVTAFVVAGVGGSLLSLAVTLLLITQAGLHGALVAVAVGQALAGVSALVVFRKVWRGRWRDLFGRPDRQALHALSGFALMAATTAVVVPLAQIAIRAGLTRLIGAEATGHWQALAKLSESHLMLLTTTLSLYFLPRFAEIADGPELAREVSKGYRFVVPLALVTASLIYVAREPMVALLFTPAFMPITEAMGWQLAGDLLKIASWVPAYTMISHARTRLFMATEVIFTCVVVVAVLLGAAGFGLVGAAIGYAITYALYWVGVHAALRPLVRRLSPDVY